MPEDLVNGIRTVIQGEVYLSPAITGIVVSQYIELLAKPPPTAQVKDASPILDTKLHQPSIHENHIHRQRLLDRLDQRLQRPLTLVAAPAGYGKTTLVSCWLDAISNPSAWISLDKNDNDLQL